MIKDTTITGDLTKGDGKLSFKTQNTIEYDFVEGSDDYLEGATKPVPFTKRMSKSELSAYLKSDYEPKLVAIENVTVNVYADADSESFHKKDIVNYYYIQSKVDSAGSQFPEEEEDDGTNGGGTDDSTTDDSTTDDTTDGTTDGSGGSDGTDTDLEGGLQIN